MRKTFNLTYLLCLVIGASEISSAQVSQSVFENTDNIITYEKSERPAATDALVEVSKSFANASEKLDLQLSKLNEESKLGLSHQYYKASYQGLPVEFGNYTAHIKEGKIYSLSGTPLNLTHLDINPAISSAQGLEEALHHMKADKYLWEESEEMIELLLPGYEKPEGELMVLPNMDEQGEKAALVYKYTVYATSPLNITDFYVSAHSGEIVFENSQTCHADVQGDGNATYEGQVAFRAEDYNGSYRLNNIAGPASSLHTYDYVPNGTSFVLFDIQSSSTTFSDSDGVQIHYAGEQTLDYYESVHGRLSYDGNGAFIRLIKGANVANNAYWLTNNAFFGDGDGVTNNSFGSLDIVGHEITHGVVQQSANLIYSKEPGALNESFADIFGESVEDHATGSHDWLLGEDVKIGNGAAFRSMSNPNTFAHPDTYKGAHWHTNSFDNYGVHTNSGVQNHWFYLLSVGGTGSTDFNENYAVVGIGMQKAQQIAYRNLTVYLTATSGYADARAGAIQSARDLYGIGSPEEVATTNAWHAVGVGMPYGSATNNCYGKTITVEVDLDNNPENIGWLIRDLSSNAFPGFTPVGSYTAAQANTSVSETIVLPGSGNYIFLIFDGSTDGLCCNSGNGSYTVLDGTTVIGSGAMFDATESFAFCSDFEAGTTADLSRPTTITDLTIGNVTSNSVELSWTPATDNIALFGYNIAQDGFMVPQTYGNTNIIIGNLTAGTTYTFDAYGFDSSENRSLKGNTVTVTTTGLVDNTPPTVPLNLVASNIGENAFDLSWDPSTDNVGVDHYDVYIDNVFNQSVNVASSSLIGLQPSTTYDCTVLAVDAAGNASATSTNLAVTTLTPSNGCGTNNFTFDIVVDGDPEDIAWYIADANNQIMIGSNFGTYQGNTNGSMISTSIPVLPSGDYALVIFDFSGDGLCCTTGMGSYELRDVSGAIVSGDVFNWGEVNEFCVDQSNGDYIDLIPPSSPVLSYTSLTSTSIDLEWTPSTDNDAVAIYALFLDGAYLGASFATDASFSNLNPGTTYEWMVLVRDVTGNVNTSQTFTVTTPQDVVETVLNEGYFESGWDGWIGGGNDCSRINNSNRAFEGNYSIRIRDNSNSSFMRTSNISLTPYDSVTVEFEYYAHSMEAGEDFFVRLRQNGSWTTVATYTKGVDFNSNGFFSGKVTLDANDYTFANNNRFRFQCDASANNDRIYIDRVIIKGYETPNNAIYNDIVMDSNLDFMPQQQADAHAYNSPTSRVSYELKISPNPASNYISVQLFEGQPQSITVLSRNGEVLLEQKEVTDQIYIGDLPSGIYFIKVIADDGQPLIEKFVKL